MEERNYKELHEKWSNNPDMPEYLKKELNKMKPKLIQERFEVDLKFGTGGLRGHLGAGTNAMNIYTVSKVTLGLANYLLKNDPKAKEKGVSICYDNRHHSEEFALVVAEVLAANGIKSYVFKELRPTPMASYAVRFFGCSAGVMITASHNPKEYNGYKVYNSEGAQLNVSQANDVISEVEKIDNIFDIKRKNDKKLIKYVLEDVQKSYLKEAHKVRIHLSDKDIDYSLKVLYSPMHGTGTNIIPQFLQDEGFDVVTYDPHMSIDPNFKNAKVVNPEFKKAWNKLPKYAAKENCDIIIMTDPDADRLGIAVRNKGEYMLLNGNQSASAILHYILEEKSKKKELPPKNGYTVSTIVTTSLLQKITQSYGLTYYETLTGFKNIADVISKRPKSDSFVFGAEESIGTMLSDFVRDKDGILGALLFSELAGYLKKEGRTIIDYLSEIYNKFGYYLNYTENIELKGKEGAEKISRIMEYFRVNGLSLKSAKVVALDDLKVLKHYNIDDETKKLKFVNDLKFDKSNVLKFYLEEGGWVIFRPSGTEPKLKIYFEVIKDIPERAESFIQKIFEEVLEQVKKI